jgi:hypothetical protein
MQICISEGHWQELVRQHKTNVYWYPTVRGKQCGTDCAGDSCKDGAKNFGRCGQVCGPSGSNACYGQKRGWNYSWQLP